MAGVDHLPSSKENGFGSSPSVPQIYFPRDLVCPHPPLTIYPHPTPSHHHTGGTKFSPADQRRQHQVSAWATAPAAIMGPTRTAKAKPASRTTPTKSDTNTPPSENEKKVYAAEIRALFAQGEKEAHAARPASLKLFPLSMPRWFARRRLDLQLAALEKGPLHGAFVDELINDVALEYIIQWDEEEKDKWPPPKDEEEEKAKTRNRKRALRITDIDSSDSSEVDDSTDYEPDDDDSSWSGSNTT